MQLMICGLMQVTAKPSNMREDSELIPVLRVLQKVEFTAALETTVLRQLARFVMYESYPAADHMVVKQGDPGALFYIILSGLRCFRWHMRLPCAGINQCCLVLCAARWQELAMSNLCRISQLHISDNHSLKLQGQGLDSKSKQASVTLNGQHTQHWNQRRSATF